MESKKILFVYGVYSIHALKRMKIFLEDSRFEIAVISRYDYSVHGIPCFKLNDYRDNVLYDNKLRLFRGYYYFKQIFCHFLFIKKIIQDFKPQIIFLQTLLYPALLFLKLKKKIPVIITFWNGDVIWWAKWDFLEKLFKYNIVKKGIKTAKIITVNSNFAKECCKKYYNREQNIIVLPYPGVDRSIFYKREDKNSVLTRYDLKDNLLFFCPRGLASYLNNEQILEAFSLLKETIDFTILFLMANANQNEIIFFNTLVTKYGLQKQIRLLNNLSQDEMAELYSASVLTISLSSNDSLPNCMLESLSCETPVLMGDIPQIREWIIDCETGFLCEIGDVKSLVEKIQIVISDNDLIKKIKKNGLLQVKNRADLEVSKYRIKELLLNV